MAKVKVTIHYELTLDVEDEFDYDAIQKQVYEELVNNDNQHGAFDELYEDAKVVTLVHKKRTCPGCLKVFTGFPALSRYEHGDICSDCGMREAFDGDFISRQKGGESK